MAKFRVGDKARIVNVTHPPHMKYSGLVVTIVRCISDLGLYEINLANPDMGCNFTAGPENLAPLTDPRAQEFVEDMRRFAVAAKKQVTA